MRHQVQVLVNNSASCGAGRRTDILECRRLTIGARLLRALFGEGKKMLVIIPGEKVESVTIKETEEIL